MIPLQVGLATDRYRVYVANYGSDTISVIDPATSQVSTIRVGDGVRPRAVAVSPDGALVYVANAYSQTMSVIDTATRRLKATIPLDVTEPTGVALSADGSQAYVLNPHGVDVIDTHTSRCIKQLRLRDLCGIATPTHANHVHLCGEGNLFKIDSIASDVPENAIAEGVGRVFTPPGTDLLYATLNSGYPATHPSVATLDPQTGSVIAQVELPGYAPVLAFAVASDGRLAYVAQGDSLFVADLMDGVLVADIPITGDWTGIAITPDGSRVYLIEPFGRVGIVDTSTNSAIAELQLTSGGYSDVADIAISPDGSTAYVTSRSGVFAINVATSTATPLIDASGPTAIAIAPDGVTALVTNNLSDNLSVIDTVTDAVIAVIPVGSRPGDVAFSPDGRFAYVAHWGEPGISVIDVRSRTLSSTMEAYVGRIAVSPDGALLYGSGSYEEVYVIDIAAGRVVKTAYIGCSGDYGLGGISFSPGRPLAYVANTDCGGITVFDTARHEAFAVIGVGDAPVQVTTSADGSVVYIASTRMSKDREVDKIPPPEIVAIDALTHERRMRVEPGDQVTDLALAPDGQRVYFTDAESIVGVDTETSQIVTTVGAGRGPLRLAVGAAPDGTQPMTPRPASTPRIIAPTENIVKSRIWPSPTPTRIPHARIALSSTVGRPGDTVTIHLKLYTDGHRVVAVQNDLAFSSRVPILEIEEGKPACSVNPNLQKVGSFAFRPHRCDPKRDCIGIRALIFSFKTVDAIPDGSVLYTCQATIRHDAFPGMHRIRVSQTGASGPAGEELTAIGVDGSITVVETERQAPERSDLHEAQRNGGGCAIDPSARRMASLMPLLVAVLLLGVRIGVSLPTRSASGRSWRGLSAGWISNLRWIAG